MQLQERERKYPPPPIYKLTFSVTPTGAKVELKKNDANGDPVTGNDNVFSNLPPGNYYYSVSATGYETQTGTVEITDEDVTQKIDLTLTTYTLTFNVTPTGSEVTLKENDANGDPITGSDNVFSNLPPGNYYYSANKAGYITKTGTVEVSNADVTKEISLEKFTFVHTLSMENPFGAYHWVYFETKTSGTFAFTGKLYFLLKEKGNAKPSVDDMTRHPNRMNRVISVTQGTAKTLTKNFTGLSGDAVVNANYQFAGTPPYHTEATRLTGVGHVLADGATYTVWVLPVATDATGQEGDIFSLGEITAGKKADVQRVPVADDFLDKDLLRIGTHSNSALANSSPDLALQIGPGERFMFPSTILNTFNDESTLNTFTDLTIFNKEGVLVFFQGPPGFGRVLYTSSTTYTFDSDNNLTTATTTGIESTNPVEIFNSQFGAFTVESPEVFIDFYTIISTELITNTAELSIIFNEGGSTESMSFTVTKVP